jgi:hypothetical protein
MPLPKGARRELVHRRAYEFEGFRREDGLWDIEARITDRKSYSFPNAYRGEVKAFEPVHDMSLRLTIDDEMVVRDIQAVSDATPYAACLDIPAAYSRMIGVRIGPGWRRAVRQRMGGPAGCTHISELLISMGTVAYQTLHSVWVKKGSQRPKGARPALLDSCYSYRSDGALARQAWPDYFEGQEKPD